VNSGEKSLSGGRGEGKVGERLIQIAILVRRKKNYHSKTGVRKCDKKGLFGGVDFKRLKRDINTLGNLKRPRSVHTRTYIKFAARGDQLFLN